MRYLVLITLLLAYPCHDPSKAIQYTVKEKVKLGLGEGNIIRKRDPKAAHEPDSESEGGRVADGPVLFHPPGAAESMVGRGPLRRFRRASSSRPMDNS